MKLPNNVYNTLKWVIMIAMPAFATFYAAISKIWGLPLGTEIVATITALTAFGGAVLQVSSKNYHNEAE